MMNISKEERSRNLRYKKPSLANLSYYAITEKLEEINEICSDVMYEYDDDAFVSAFDDDEEEAFEFKFAFSGLSSEAAQLYDNIREEMWYEDDPERAFDDLSVALIGNRFNMVGYDDCEEDYYALTSYDAELAVKEAGKRVMRMTKADMLSKIGQVMGIVLSFHNVELKYEYLKSSIDILMDKSRATLRQIKAIEAAYEEAEDEGFFLYGHELRGEKVRHFEQLIGELPDKVWVE